MELLHIDHLAVSIADKPILSDVSLTVNAGEIVGLLGPNGAGKSTTIAAALGLLRRRAGVVATLGRDPASSPWSIYRDIGVLPERNGFYDWMTGEDYLDFFAGVRGEDPSPGRTAERLAAVGLSPSRGQPIGAYSRGMRQRLGLARALIGEPKLVILDEPTNGLDPRGRHDVHDLLRGLAARGAGVLMCTHLLDDVERLCSRAAVIVGGRTVAEGPIADLAGSAARSDRYRLRLAAPLRDPIAVRGLRLIEADGPDVLVESDGTEAPERLWSRLFGAGWPIIEIRGEAAGLESLYLSLTEEPERKAA